MHLLFFMVLNAFAGNGSVQVLSAGELAAHPGDYQIVDGREPEAFSKGHVPASRSLPWKEFTEEKPGAWTWLFGHPQKWGLVRTDASIEKSLRALGLSHRKPIAVLGDPASPGSEGRAAWSLLYWGAQSVSLIDGGYPAWVALPGSQPESGAMRPLPAGDFVVTLRPERRARLSDVDIALRTPGRSILDVRTESEFTGETARGQKRGGHLPRAQLVPASSLYEATGKFLSTKKLKEKLPTLNSPVTYCTGGVRSSLLAMLLEARLGMVVANYDGSLWEYSSHADLPLVQ